MRTLVEIRADVEALEQETDGLLEQVFVDADHWEGAQLWARSKVRRRLCMAAIHITPFQAHINVYHAYGSISGPY